MDEEEGKWLYLDEVKEPFNFYNNWLFIKGQLKWQSGSGSYKKLVELEDSTSEILIEKKSNEKKTATHSSEENKENQNADHPIGNNKAAKQAHAEDVKKNKSFEEMNVASMWICALAQHDAIAFNIMKQVPDSEASKEWFSMKAEQGRCRRRLGKEKRRGVLKAETNF